MHEVLVNRLGGLSLPRKSLVRLTDRPDMTLDVYSKDRVKHDSFRVFNAFVTSFSCVCMKRVLKRVDSRFSRYKRVSQQPIKSAL